MNQQKCSLCGEEHDELIYKLEKKLEAKFVKKIQEEHPHWVQSDGACERCVNYYKSMVQHPTKGKMLKDIVDRVAAKIRFKKFLEEE